MYQETATYKKLKDRAQDNHPAALIIHHTGGEGGVDTSNQTAKIVEDYHISQGWEGIGYHFFIAKDGGVWRGRPEQYHGSHTKELSMNTKSLGICLAGNFDITMPTLPQIFALKILMVDLMVKYNIPVADIYPHRHFALGSNGKPYKSCFGTKLSDTWARDLVSPPSVSAIDKDSIKSQIKALLEQL